MANTPSQPVQPAPQEAETQGSSYSEANLQPENQAMCGRCWEDFPRSTLERLLCGHEYCNDCLKALFEDSINGKIPFPTRCCSYLVPLSLRASQILTADLIKRFHEKREELDADKFKEKSTYCHVPRCSTLLKRRDIVRNMGVCPKCAALTCIVCKEKYHDNGECTQEGGLRVPEIEDLAEREGWRRCHSCRQMIESKGGCLQMRQWSSIFVTRCCSLC